MAKKIKKAYLDRDIIPAMDALNKFIKESTSSVKKATKALQEAGILNKKGKLHKRYR